MRHVARHFRKLFVHELEDRCTPAIMIGLSGTTVTFTGDGANDGLLLSVGGTGLLTHNVSLAGLASNTDLDASTAGVQSLAVNSITNLTVNLGGGTDSYSSADVGRPGSILGAENFYFSTFNGGDLTFTDTTFAYNGVSTSWNPPTNQFQISGDAGENIFDASALTGTTGIYMAGFGGADILRGGKGNDDLRGGDGDDLLEGNDGNDLLDYNDGGQRGGNDTLRGGAGNDNFQSDNGPGNISADIFDGGPGTDYAIDVGTIITLTDTTYTTDGVVSPNHGIERWDLYGTAGNDSINASAWSGIGMLMYGYGGNDTLRGGAGNDDIRGGDGDDTLEGNGGNDALDYNDAGQRGGNDILRGGPGNDFLQSDNAPNNFSADIFDGGPDNDIAYDAGNQITLTDTTYTTDGAVSLNHGVETWNLYGTTGNDTIDTSAWSGNGMFLYGYAGNDTLRGGAGSDDIRGGDGDDTLEGFGGTDYLDFNDVSQRGGNDILRGGEGNDFLCSDFGPTNFSQDIYEGGNGTDRVDDSGANIVLTDTTFTTDGRVTTNHGVENWFLYGTTGNDTIDGSAWTGGGLYLYGYAGNDTLRGGAGSDDIRGGDGDDLLEGNAGTDYLDWNDSNQRGGNDTLRGGPGNDFLSSDTSPANASADIYEGGPDMDRVDDAASIATLTNSTYISNGAVSNNHDVEIWYFYGTNGADSIDASGYSGGVTIYAFGGSDTLQGGNGNDDIRGGDGDDMIVGNDGNDDLDWNDPAQRNGNDTITGGDGNDRLAGGAGDDTLRDGPGTNLLDGGADTDTVVMYGTPGVDTLVVTGNTFGVNGGSNTPVNCEILTGDMLGGIDEGTQTAAPTLLPYTIANLEPTVSAGPDVANTDIPFIFTRVGSFKDIGNNQTWTGQVNYGEGLGFQPLSLNPDKSFTLNNAYSSGGIFNVTVRITDNGGSVGEDSFVLIRPAGIQVGVAGGSQRSMIEKLTISFDKTYTLAPGWFNFQRLSPGAGVTVTESSIVTGGKTIATLSFSGAGMDVGGKSLQDGDWRLLLNSNFITNNGNAFDGDADGNPGGNFNFPFHRLFGDVNGDRTVDGGTDFAQYGLTFGSSVSSPNYTAAFDFNADGTIDGGTDFAQFGIRFGRTL